MKDVKEKRCPFRVCRVERPPMLRGNGTTWTEEFYNCLGEECAAYCHGGCLRLVPPYGGSPLRIRKDPTAADIEKLLDEMRNGLVAPLQPGEVPW